MFWAAGLSTASPCCSRTARYRWFLGADKYPYSMFLGKGVEDRLGIQDSEMGNVQALPG